MHTAPITPPAAATTALLVIDVQNDFMEGGALAVPDAAQILPTINALIAAGDYALIVATQDMHPAQHVSFGLWPVHCVQGTPGAELHPRLLRDQIDVIWRKGLNPAVDSYGAFEDNTGRTTHLADLLKAKGITAVDVVGLATDYCVGTTALQAARHFKTRVLLAACKGVGIHPGDIPGMIANLHKAGAEVLPE
jgi:nicotinamidase/pyrazinamidase